MLELVGAGGEGAGAFFGIAGQPLELALRPLERAHLAIGIVRVARAAQLVEGGGIDQVAQHRGVGAHVAAEAAGGGRAAAAGRAAEAAARGRGAGRRGAGSVGCRGRGRGVLAVAGGGGVVRRRARDLAIGARLAEPVFVDRAGALAQVAAPLDVVDARRIRCTSRRSLSSESRSRSAFSASSRGPSSGSIETVGFTAGADGASGADGIAKSVT